LSDLKGAALRLALLDRQSACLCPPWMAWSDISEMQFLRWFGIPSQKTAKVPPACRPSLISKSAVSQTLFGLNQRLPGFQAGFPAATARRAPCRQTVRALAPESAVRHPP